MLTLKLFHPNGQKEVAHFQSLDKCVQWMNLHSKKVNHIILMDSKINKPHEFNSKHAFEEFAKQQGTK